jgi:hypothetical protein
VSREPALGSEERIEIAKICLPFVHPRIVQLQPAGTGGEPGPEPEAKPQPQKPIDICDPEYMIALVRTLNSAMSEYRERGQEVSHFVWHALKYLPRRPDELNAPMEQMLKGFT